MLPQISPAHLHPFSYENMHPHENLPTSVREMYESQIMILRYKLEKQKGYIRNLQNKDDKVIVGQHLVIQKLKSDNVLLEARLNAQLDWRDKLKLKYAEAEESQVADKPATKYLSYAAVVQNTT